MALMLAAPPASAQRSKSADRRTATTKKKQAKTQQQKKTQTTVSSLQQKQKQLQRDTEAKRRRKEQVEQGVKRGMESLILLNSEISEKRRVIDTIRNDISSLDAGMALMRRQLDTLAQELEERKQKFMTSMRYLHRNRSTQNQLMFVLSADNFNQMYRRMRFTRTYATFQRAQGEAVKLKQGQIEQKKAQLAKARQRKDTLLTRGQHEQLLLEQKQSDQKRQVDALQKEQRTLAVLIERQQRQEADLNAQIDKLVAEEIARAKAKAEAEARQKAAAEAAKKRKAELARKRAAAEAARKENERRIAAAKAAEEKAKSEARAAERKSAAERAAAQRRARQAEQARRQAEQKAIRENSARQRDIAQTQKADEEHYTMPAADRKLSGSFEQNQGRLPMPVAGAYRMLHSFGSNVIEGLKNVHLQSKGIYLKTAPGTQARSIFEGEVSAIFLRGGRYVVMIRHGKYISFYYGLSSVSVRAGQHVEARQTIGAIDADGVLQFQLRKLRQVLNPMKWLGK